MLEGKDEDPDAVRLSTVHASKGLEYPHVFLVGVEEGIMPHRVGSNYDNPIDDARIEEERRLMYVAITQAQRSLHLNWCKKRKRAGDGGVRAAALHPRNAARRRAAAHGGRSAAVAEGSYGDVAEGLSAFRSSK